LARSLCPRSQVPRFALRRPDCETAGRDRFGRQKSKGNNHESRSLSTEEETRIRAELGWSLEYEENKRDEYRIRSCGGLVEIPSEHWLYRRKPQTCNSPTRARVLPLQDSHTFRARRHIAGATYGASCLTDSAASLLSPSSFGYSAALLRQPLPQHILLRAPHGS